MAKVYTRQEVRQRKMGFQIFAGIFDFIAVIVGLIVIVGCIILLVSLVKWALRDGVESFTGLWNILRNAIIVPK